MMETTIFAAAAGILALALGIKNLCAGEFRGVFPVAIGTIIILHVLRTIIPF